MSKHVIGKNFLSDPVAPEFDTKNLLANIESIKFAKKFNYEDERQKYFSEIALKAKINGPEKYSNVLVEVCIVPSVATSAVCISEDSQHGIGLLEAHLFKADVDFFSLSVALENEFYKELEQFLFISNKSKGLQISLQASVRGLGDFCKWEMHQGPLLVEAISFFAS